MTVAHTLRGVIHRLFACMPEQIGSGFDVSAACYGSQRYTRFPASTLGEFTSSEALLPSGLKECLQDSEKWGVSRRIVRRVRRCTCCACEFHGH